MKNKALYIALGIFSALCAVVALTAGGEALLQELLLGGVYVRVGGALRQLSLSGGAGNAAAIIIYIVLCCLPLVLGAKGLARGKRENWLLAAMSAALFPVIYLAVNPGHLAGWREGMGVSLLVSGMGNCCSGLLLAWAVFRILRVSRETESLRIFRVLLWLLAAALCCAVCGVSLAELRTKLGSFDMQSQFAVLGFVVGALPLVLDIVLVLRGEALLAAFELDRHSEETAGHAESLSRLAAFSLKLTVLVSLGYNILQLMFLRSLTDISIDMDIPLLPLALALAALLLSRLIKENRALKQESDMFI